MVDISDQRLLNHCVCVCVSYRSVRGCPEESPPYCRYGRQPDKNPPTLGKDCARASLEETKENSFF